MLFRSMMKRSMSNGQRAAMDIKTLLRLQGVKSMELSKALHFLYKLKYFWTCLGMENIIEILSAEKAPKKRNTESLCGKQGLPYTLKVRFLTKQVIFDRILLSDFQEGNSLRKESP